MLNIKPTHKPIKQYYAELKEYERLGEQNEGTVRAAFQSLLQHYSRQADLTLICEKSHAFTPDKRSSGRTAPNRRIRPDGELFDAFKLSFGHWEAKDTQDDLYVEADKKFAAGYPSKNIVVQSRPTHSCISTDNSNSTSTSPNPETSSTSSKPSSHTKKKTSPPGTQQSQNSEKPYQNSAKN